MQIAFGRVRRKTPPAKVGCFVSRNVNIFSDFTIDEAVGWVERNIKRRCRCSKYPKIRPVVISIQERSETQLHTARVRDTSRQNSWVSLGLCLM